MEITSKFYNEDCVQGAKKYIPANSVDLIVTDPPYGIQSEKMHKSYNRDESMVVEGYVEIPAAKYQQFSNDWIAEAGRILRPGGAIFVVSGYTHLSDIIVALRAAGLQEVNHIIWKYNFGVYTSCKFVSSHYHILYYVKPGGRPTFNLECRYSLDEKRFESFVGLKSMNYEDREDVWCIDREYKPKKLKNRNELPFELLRKIIMYSSNEGDTVVDFFLGGFSTAVSAIGLNRRFIGFELSEKMFNAKIGQVMALQPGFIIPTLKKVVPALRKNKGKAWTPADKCNLWNDYNKMRRNGKNKGESVQELAIAYGRGKFSILNVLAEMLEVSKTAISIGNKGV
jgi:site-specific DNA-methyltransferase (adenine-specific)